MRRVLLLSPRAPVTLELARLFHRAGDHVVVADSLALHLCRWSGAVARSVTVPPPRQQTAAWLDALVRIVEEERIEWIVPTCEEVFWLAEVQEELARRAPGCRVLVDVPATMMRLHDKHRFTELCAQIGFPAPTTQLLTAHDDVVATAPRAAELVFKPVFSRFASRVLLRPSPEVALRAVTASIAEPWVAQRFVAGRQLCVYAAAMRGRLTVFSAYGAPHRAGPGASIYFESEPAPVARRFVESVASALSFTGQLSFDFIEAEDGALFPLECNPRATSGAHLFVAVDDLPGALLGERAAAIVPSTGAPRMLYWPMVFFGWRAGLRRWWRDLARARDVIHDRRDPGPTLAQIGTGMSLLFRGFAHGITALQASTVDIEHNGPARDGAGHDANGEASRAA